MALRTVGVKLMADVSGYISGLQRAGKATANFKGELDKAAKKGNLDAVADKAAMVGVGLAGMAVAAFKSAADFDKSMSAVAAATHAPQAEIGKLRAAALKAGKDTAFSATEAADGITELSKAGVSTANILGGGLKGALDLAAAGQLGVGEAAEISASALTQFKLQGSQVPHVADLLAASAGKAQGSVHDMGAALNQSGLVAAQFGLSIEDTTGVLAEFASAGLVGSDSGTSFKTMLLALANPSNQTAKQMQELGINFYDAQGKFVGLSGVAQILQEKLKGLTQEQRNQALGQIFGNDAIRAASILYTDGAKGVEQWKGAVNDAGYASETAQIQTDNLAGDIERLKGSLETLAIQAGSGGNSGLRIVAKSLNEIVDSFASMPPVASATITIMAALGGAALIALAGFVKLRKGLASAVVELEAMGPAGAKAAGGLQAVAGAAGVVGVAFVAVEAATQIINSFTKSSADVDRLTDSLTNFANTGKVSGEAATAFGADLSGIGKDAARVNDAISKTISEGNDMVPVVGGLIDSLVKLGDNIGGSDDYKTALANFAALDTAMTTSMTTTNDAAKAQALWSEVLSKSGLDTDQLAKLLPNAYKEVGALNNASMKAKDSVGGLGAAAKGTTGALAGQAAATNDLVDENGKYKSATDAVKGALLGQTDALKQLSNFMRAQADPVFALLQGQRDLKKAHDDASKAIDTYGKNSQKAKDATNKLAGAAIDLQGDVGALGTQFDGKMTPALRDTLKAGGLTSKQINVLTGEFKDAKKAADQYAGKYEAKVVAPSASQAKKDIDRAYVAGKQYDGTYVARLSINGESEVSSKLDALLVKQRALQTGLSVSAARGAVQKDLDINRKYGLATGGQVAGWSPHSKADNIPAWLTAEEWVHPVDSVKYYGPQLMSAIQHRQVPREMLAAFASGNLGKRGDLPIGLASGGQVPWRFADTVARTKIPSWDEVQSKIPGGSAASFLRAQDGKPYVWASAGPGGFDCSGIVSAVYNLLHGRSPYSHTFSTGSLPGGWFTKPGIGGPLTAAWSNPGEAPASSTTGHMMGMAGGLTFESTGGRGVHLGATTRRLTDFAHIAHYAGGGRVEDHVAMKNGGTIAEPIFGVGASGTTYQFGENYQPEKVVPNWQAGNGGGGGGMNVTINLTAQLAAGANMREAGRQIAEQLGSHLGAGGTIPVRTRQVTL